MDKRTTIALLALVAVAAFALKGKKKPKPRLVSNTGYTQPTKIIKPPTNPPVNVDLSQKVLPFHWFLDMPRTNITAGDTPLDLIGGA